MKKNILTIALAILLAQAIFVPAYLLIRQSLADHKALVEVVNFINQSIAQQQEAAKQAK